ncbi:MAG: fructosamine kinase family protein [Corynebacterium sp.]|uniref:fructosamine kinase family protein n=1 Tax=Corynebacterium sp. TaxID=1720 RepID=UPI0026DECD48|nr:fructosamine kinase family protein [Corynebacterium sp.]MDO5671188.1 fructosamine kinase family protein [Corynebacterium sp.]
MSDVFTKQPREPRSAEAEAAGLRWLREGSDCVAEVVLIDAAANRLQTRLVTEVSPTQEAARQAGRELARIHAAGAPAFGAPPAGWEGPNYIGTQEQECTPTPHWGEFYANQRVLPFARHAMEAGNLDPEGYAVVAQACAAIVGTPWDVAPARIHGDLWAGNLLFAEEGPVFIDPAAHGGHPLTDLAMLALFGVPFREDVWRGYQEVTALPEDFRAHFPMHQLHPLAVHTLTHGRSYARPLVTAARETLELLG